MSIAARSGRWLRRELRQVGEGTLGRHGIHLPTVAWLILMPSLSSSPWMRGAPHDGLAMLIRRIRSRISVSILGRPGRRDCQRQKKTFLDDMASDNGFLALSVEEQLRALSRHLQSAIRFLESGVLAIRARSLDPAPDVSKLVGEKP